MNSRTKRKQDRKKVILFIELLGQDSDKVISEFLEVPLSVVSSVRKNIGIKNCRYESLKAYHRYVVKCHQDILGQISDSDIAQFLEVSPIFVAKVREDLGIPTSSYLLKKHYSCVIKSHRHLLGQISDSEIAELFEVPLQTVTKIRENLDINNFQYDRVKKYQDLLGQTPDSDIAEFLEMPIQTVTKIRKKLNIPKYSSLLPGSMHWMLDTMTTQEIRSRTGYSTGNLKRKEGRRKTEWNTPKKKELLQKYGDILGQISDSQIGELAGMTRSGVAYVRKIKNIPLCHTIFPRSLYWMLGIHTDIKTSKITGYFQSAVSKARHEMSICPAIKPWTEFEESFLGTMSDEEVAEEIGRSESAVKYKRLKLKIPNTYENSTYSKYTWPKDKIQFLKDHTPKEAAEIVGCSLKYIYIVRHKHEITMSCPPTLWTNTEIKLLGTMSDKDVAKKIGRSIRAIRDKRYKLKISRYR